MVDLQNPIWFGIFQSLAAIHFLRMSFIEKQTQTTLLMDCKIVLDHSAAVAILGRDAKVYVTPLLSHEAPVDERNEH